jgi:hypothetical protein
MDATRLRDLFDRAVALPTADRTAFLKRACEDEDLRHHVERLLAAHERQGSVFDTMPSSEAADSHTATDSSSRLLTPSARLGPYSIARGARQWRHGRSL